MSNNNGVVIDPRDELWDGDLLVLSKEQLRIAMWHDMGCPYGDAYLAHVDKVWNVIAAAVERGDL